MKKIGLLTVLLIASLSFQAQVVHYICQAPPIQVEGAKTIWVENLQVKEAVGWWITLDRGIPQQIKTQITWSTRGGAVAQVFSPWMRTNWYHLAKSREEADIIIEGTVEASRTEKKDVSEETFIAQQDTKIGKKVPYVVRSYDYARHLNMQVSFTIKKQDGTVLKQLDFPVARASEKKSKGVAPKLASWSAFKRDAMKDVSSKVVAEILPIMQKRTVPFIGYKPTDKKKWKTIKNLGYSSIQDLKTRCRIYESDLEAGGEQAMKALGIMHYMLGNYTTAEKYLIAGNHPQAQEVIAEMKATTEMFRKMGIEPFESEL